jgi:hypothetical protein
LEVQSYFLEGKNRIYLVLKGSNGGLKLSRSSDNTLPATVEAAAPAYDGESVDALSFDTLMPKTFLQEDMVAPWLDQKQLLFVGPPGTGKTYLAQQLSAYLLGSAARGGVIAGLELASKGDCTYALVQFSQSSTYADFIQGMRGGGQSLSNTQVGQSVIQAVVDMRVSITEKILDTDWLWATAANASRGRPAHRRPAVGPHVAQRRVHGQPGAGEGRRPLQLGRTAARAAACSSQASSSGRRGGQRQRQVGHAGGGAGGSVGCGSPIGSG